MKPVLFATLDESRIAAARATAPRAPLAGLAQRIVEPLTLASRTVDSYRRDTRLADVAVVVDLPGARAVDVGIALIAHGFAPVPLFNALPASITDHSVEGIVDVEPIIDALVAHAGTAARATLAACPAFLLDANRLGEGRALEIGRFDNRSVSHPSDFPSADTLWSHGIRRALLVCEDRADDVEPTLTAWRHRGIECWQLDPRAERIALFPFRERGWFGRALRGLSRTRGPDARADGSYGLMILPPTPSSS